MAAVVEMEDRLGGPVAFHAGGILAGKLKLKCGPWALHKTCPGRTAETELGASWVVPWRSME